MAINWQMFHHGFLNLFSCEKIAQINFQIFPWFSSAWISSFLYQSSEIPSPSYNDSLQSSKNAIAEIVSCLQKNTFFPFFLFNRIFILLRQFCAQPKKNKINKRKHLFPCFLQTIGQNNLKDLQLAILESIQGQHLLLDFLECGKNKSQFCLCLCYFYFQLNAGKCNVSLFYIFIHCFPCLICSSSTCVTDKPLYSQDHLKRLLLWKAFQYLCKFSQLCIRLCSHNILCKVLLEHLS